MVSENKIKSIIDLSNKMRKVILEVSYKCGQPAHIGGALSIIEILATLYEDILEIDLKNPFSQRCSMIQHRLCWIAWS